METYTTRKSIRLKDFNYSENGWYYVTICIQNRLHLLSTITHETIQLLPPGHMIDTFWKKLPTKFPQITLHEYVIMPNHIHGILSMHENNSVGADPRVGPSLSEVIRWFKTMTTNEYIKNVRLNHWSQFDKKIWQRSYYDHIIRNETDYKRIIRYIGDNPKNWETDEENRS